jgi:hypothetical protein
MKRKWIFKVLSGGMNNYTNAVQTVAEVEIEAYTLGEAWGKIGQWKTLNMVGVTLARVSYI